MKFFWYVKALHIIHETEMTKIMPTRTSPGLSDTTHRAKWSVNVVLCRLLFDKTVHRQPNADWPLFRVCLSEDRKQTVKWRVTSVSFLFCKWRPYTDIQKEREREREIVAAAASLFFSLKTVHRQPNGEFPQFSLCFSQWRQCTDRQTESDSNFLFFSMKTAHRQANGEWPLSTVLGEDSTRTV